MRQNALLRSAKGLETPGPTRKKVAPVAVVASAPVEEREDHFAIRNGVRCAGVHLIVDLHGAEGLDDIDLIENTLRRCVDAAGATLLHIHLHHFSPNGVSGTYRQNDSVDVVYQRQAGRDDPPTAALVDHVDAVVLPVGAGHAEEEREPAPEAELPFTRERPLEDELASLPPEVLPWLLDDAVGRRLRSSTLELMTTCPAALLRMTHEPGSAS